MGDGDSGCGIAGTVAIGDRDSGGVYYWDSGGVYYWDSAEGLGQQARVLWLYPGGVKSIRERPVETSHYISINDPVSQSYIYQTPSVHYSPVSRTEYPKQPPYSSVFRDKGLAELQLFEERQGR